MCCGTSPTVEIGASSPVARGTHLAKRSRCPRAQWAAPGLNLAGGGSCRMSLGLSGPASDRIGAVAAGPPDSGLGLAALCLWPRRPPWGGRTWSTGWQSTPCTASEPSWPEVARGAQCDAGGELVTFLGRKKRYEYVRKWRECPSRPSLAPDSSPVSQTASGSTSGAVLRSGHNGCPGGLLAVGLGEDPRHGNTGADEEQRRPGNNEDTPPDSEGRLANVRTVDPPPLVAGGCVPMWSKRARGPNSGGGPGDRTSGGAVSLSVDIITMQEIFRFGCRTGRSRGRPVRLKTGSCWRRGSGGHRPAGRFASFACDRATQRSPSKNTSTRFKLGGPSPPDALTSEPTGRPSPGRR